MNYRENEAINFSTLKEMKNSPLDYKLARDFPTPSTDSMKFGTLIHMMLLQPELLDKTYIVMPKVDLRTKEGKEKRQEIIESNPGKIVIPEQGDIFSWEKAEKIVNYNKEKRLLKTVLQQIEIAETEVYADCQETNLKLKGLIDAVTKKSIIDIKTIGTLGKIPINIRAFDYIGQLAFYDYLARLNNTTREQHYLLFIETTSPYKAKLVEISKEQIEKKHSQNIGLLQKVKKCTETNEWPDGSEVMLKWGDSPEEREEVLLF